MHGAGADAAIFGEVVDQPAIWTGVTPSEGYRPSEQLDIPSEQMCTAGMAEDAALR
jgi:hypothetical protein